MKLKVKNTCLNAASINPTKNMKMLPKLYDINQGKWRRRLANQESDVSYAVFGQATY